MRTLSRLIFQQDSARRVSLPLAILLCLGVALGASAQSGKPKVYDPVWSPDGKWIAFYSDADGDDEIYLLELSSSEIIQLTDNERLDSNPEWIADGHELSFTSDRDGTKEIYRIDIESRAVHRLTFNEDPESAHSWSFDGSEVVFESRRNENNDLFVLTLNGTEVRMTKQLGNDFRPTWCGNDRVVFQSRRGDHYHLYSISPRGTDLRQLTSANHHDAGPDCGRTSGRIVYVVHREDGRSKIHVMEADGSNDRELTNGSEGSDFAPSWSPDEHHIVYVSDRDGFLSLYRMASDGTGQERLETNFDSVSRVEPLGRH